MKQKNKRLPGRQLAKAKLNQAPAARKAALDGFRRERIGWLRRSFGLAMQATSGLAGWPSGGCRSCQQHGGATQQKRAIAPGPESPARKPTKYIVVVHREDQPLKRSILKYKLICVATGRLLGCRGNPSA
uniref:Uncharacterized protein n=1 Tax=Tanacetum cinerariifolium TaxID=118510 RepID=A0A699UQ80_TANCI|nr:hypothetical protein [Tanacetum cinerariifolium]